MHRRSVHENISARSIHTTMLSPYTVLSLAPAPAPAPEPAPEKLSLAAAAAAAMQFRKQPPSVVALPWAASYASNKESRFCRRRRTTPLFTCHAKYDYSDLQPNALEASALFSFDDGKGGTEFPKASTLLAGNNWSIMGDKDVLILKLKVGDSPAPEDKKKFKFSTAPGQAGLVIRYTEDGGGGGKPASELMVPLTMPRGYDGGKVQATWFHDWLLVLVAKPKHDPMEIQPSNPGPAEGNNTT